MADLVTVGDRVFDADVTPSIHAAMAAILAELPAIGKNQRNEQQGFSFRGIDDVLDALKPLLGKHGVFFLPRVIERIAATRTTARGTVMYEVNLHVEFTFYGPRGDSVTGSGWGEGTDAGDKATNKAMTAALKYVLGQAFAIATHEDADRSSPEETVALNAMSVRVDEVVAKVKQAGRAKEVREQYGKPPWSAGTCDRIEEFLVDADEADQLNAQGEAQVAAEAEVKVYPPGEEPF